MNKIKIFTLAAITLLTGIDGMAQEQETLVRQQSLQGEVGLVFYRKNIFVAFRGDKTKAPYDLVIAPSYPETGVLDRVQTLDEQYLSHRQDNIFSSVTFPSVLLGTVDLQHLFPNEPPKSISFMGTMEPNKGVNRIILPKHWNILGTTGFLSKSGSNEPNVLTVNASSSKPIANAVVKIDQQSTTYNIAIARNGRVVPMLGINDVKIERHANFQITNNCSLWVGNQELGNDDVLTQAANSTATFSKQKVGTFFLQAMNFYVDQQNPFLGFSDYSDGASVFFTRATENMVVPATVNGGNGLRQVKRLVAAPHEVGLVKHMTLPASLESASEKAFKSYTNLQTLSFAGFFKGGIELPGNFEPITSDIASLNTENNVLTLNGKQGTLTLKQGSRQLTIAVGGYLVNVNSSNVPFEAPEYTMVPEGCTFTADGITYQAGDILPPNTAVTFSGSNPGTFFVKSMTQTAQLSDFNYHVIAGNDISLDHYLGCASQLTIPATFTEGGTTYTVKQLSENCFNENSNLASIDLSQTQIESILKFCFYKNIKLKTVKLPASLKFLGDLVFSDCHLLEEVDLSKTQIESIENFSFSWCEILRTALFPTTLKSIGESAFAGCNMSQVDLSNTQVNSIGNYSFQKCKVLKTVLFPTTLKSLGESAFADCSILEHVDLSNTQVDNIQKECFHTCTSLTTALFPTTLKSLGDMAFAGCNLSQVDLSNTQVGRIGNSGFIDCGKLKTVSLPTTLKSLGEFAFAGCSFLKQIDLSNTQLDSIANCSFVGCFELTTALFPTTLKSLGESAFAGCKLSQVDLSNTQVESIGKQCFKKCDVMKTILFPTTLKSIGESAFVDCSFLEQADLSETQVENIGNCGFFKCLPLKSSQFPTTLKSLGHSAFTDCKQLKQIDLSQTKVELIDKKTFFGCENLTTVQLPATLQAIRDSAFANCTLLTEIGCNNIPTLEEETFRNDHQLFYVQTSSNTPAKYVKGMLDTNQQRQLLLCVPTGAKQAYVDQGWDFAQIIELDDVQFGKEYPVKLVAGEVKVMLNGVERTDGWIPAKKVGNKLESTDQFKLQSVSLENLSIQPNLGIYEFDVNKPCIILKVYAQMLYLELIDNIPYTSDKKEYYSHLIYTRNFDSNWQPLYLPFSMEYDNWKADFDVARLNNFIETDDNNDGKTDRTLLETVYLKEGSQTKENMLYMIRAKKPGKQSIHVKRDLILVTPAVETSIDCYSFSKNYVFTGIYTPKTVFGPGEYVMGGGKLGTPGPTAKLGGYRWYLTITDRNGVQVVNANNIYVIARGEDDLTSIETISPDAPQHFDIYDMNGRLVKRGATTTEGLSRGIYIINKKKFIKY